MMNRLLPLACPLLLAACGTTNVYRDTWQPLSLEVERSARPVVKTALLIEHPPEMQALESAGATLLGYHQARDAWARRAGSTGGTHFMPVVADEGSEQRNCNKLQAGGVGCVTHTDRGEWTRIAVYRVAPERWGMLPPYLVPLKQTLQRGTKASAIRSGCEVDQARGTTKCKADWKVQAP